MIHKFLTYFFVTSINLILTFNSYATPSSSHGEFIDEAFATGPSVAGVSSLDNGAPVSPSVRHKVNNGDMEGTMEAVEPSTNSVQRGLPPSQPRRYEIRADRPRGIFKFLGEDYKGILIPGAVEQNDDIRYYESAVVFYDPNQAQRSEVYKWDDTAEFMRQTDALVFNIERSKPSLILGSLGFIIGLVPSIPSTGAVNSAIGAFFGTEKGGVESTFFSVWIMTTTTFNFAMTLGERGKIIADSLLRKGTYPTRSDENESKPCVVKTSKRHKVAIGFLVAASILEGIVNMGTLARAYLEKSEGSFYAFGWAYGAWMERYYTMGREKIDRIFCQYYYDTKLSHQKRMLLLSSLRKCQKAIAAKDSFANALHDKILGQINKHPLLNEENGQQNLFALSLLFLLPDSTKSYDEDDVVVSPDIENSGVELDEKTRLLNENASLNSANAELTNANARLTNFQTQQDATESWKEDFLDSLSTHLTGAAAVGRIISVEFLLEFLMTHILSMPAPVATGIAWSAAVFDALFRASVEGDTQKQYMRGWLNSFSLTHLGDFQWIRKIAGWPTIANGGLFALARTVAGIAALNSWGAPLPLQIICLLPAFMQDLAYYGSYFEAGKEAIITNAATVMRPKLDDRISIKRAWLLKWSRKVEKLLESQWDRETIGKLYSIILKGF